MSAKIASQVDGWRRQFKPERKPTGDGLSSGAIQDWHALPPEWAID